MKIESLIKRKGGSRISLGATTYYFKPEEDGGPHVADVTDEAHIKLLLRIPQYVALEDLPETLPEESTERQLAGSTIHNASYTVKGGETITLEELVEVAFDDSGLTEDEWNGLSDEDRYERIDLTLKDLSEDEPETAAQEGSTEETEELDRAALSAAYKERFGRQPSNLMKTENIKLALDKDAE